MSKSRSKKRSTTAPLPPMSEAEENDLMKKLLAWPNATGAIMDIPPSIAAILAKHNRNYRKAKATTVRKCADDMRRGDWTPNYADNLVVYRCGGKVYVHNGQHRLAAVLESGVTIQMMVVVTDNETCAGNIDMHPPRAPKDVFLGDLGIDDGRAPSLARILIVQQGGHRAETSMAKKKRAYLQYADGIRFVMANTPGKKGVTTPVMAAAVRAYYSVTDTDRLAEFLVQMAHATHTGPSDDAARILRNTILTRKMSEDEVARKAEAALYKFMNRTPCSSLVTAAFNGEFYPIPPFNDGVISVITPSRIKEIEGSILLEPRQHKSSLPVRIQVVCRAAPRVWHDPSLLAKTLQDFYGKKYTVDEVRGALSRMRKQELEDIYHGEIGRTFKIRYMPTLVFSSKDIKKKHNK
jgi:hypothetical protein